MSISLANKYRPEGFEDVLGQVATVAALKGKLAENRLPRVSLFCGAHGSGKTTVARILAKAINCKSPLPGGGPCCQCDSCLGIDLGSNPDVLELDAASHNKVEDAEAIIEKVSYLPNGNKKVIILDEVHMLTKEAQNKLLKIIEEPPKHVVFILCTTEESRILPTIVSRCNKFEFRKIAQSDIISNLERICQLESIEYERDALVMIAKAADGHVRDSLSILEQLSYEKLTKERVSSCLGISTDEQIFHILEAVALQDVAEVLDVLMQVFNKSNLSAFVKRVVEILCYLLMHPSGVSSLEETTEFLENIESLRPYYSNSICVEYIHILTDTLKGNRGLGLEMAVRLSFLKMTIVQEQQDRITELETAVASLKQLVESGITQAAKPARKDTEIPSEALQSEDTCVPVPSQRSLSISELPQTITLSMDEIPFDKGFEELPDEELPCLMQQSDAEVPTLKSKPDQVLETVPTMAAGFQIPGGILHTESLPSPAETLNTTEYGKEAPVQGETGGFINSFDSMGSIEGMFGSTKPLW